MLGEKRRSGLVKCRREPTVGRSAAGVHSKTCSTNRNSSDPCVGCSHQNPKPEVGQGIVWREFMRKNGCVERLPTMSNRQKVGWFAQVLATHLQQPAQCCYIGLNGEIARAFSLVRLAPNRFRTASSVFRSRTGTFSRRKHYPFTTQNWMRFGAFFCVLARHVD